MGEERVRKWMRGGGLLTGENIRLYEGKNKKKMNKGYSNPSITILFIAFPFISPQ